MKRIRLSEIAKKPKYLAEFPLLGKTIASIGQCVQKENGYQIGSPGMIPPFGQLIQTGETYALIDSEGETAEVTIAHRESQSAIAVPLTDDDAIVLETLQPISIAELRIVKILDPNRLPAGDHICFEKVAGKIRQLRHDPSYNFRNNLIQSFLDTEEAKKTIEDLRSKFEATSVENKEEREKIRFELLIYQESLIEAGFKQREESVSVAEDEEKFTRDRVINLKILDFSRQQIEILGGLESGRLAYLAEEDVQVILGTINAPDEESEAESAPEKPKRGRTAKKDKQPMS